MSPFYHWPPASLAKAINRHPVLRPLQKLKGLLTVIFLVLAMVALAVGLGLGLGLKHASSPQADKNASVIGMHASAHCSDASGKYQLDGITAPVVGYGNPVAGANTWNLTIDDTLSGFKQIIKGFGATVTDATVATFTEQANSTLEELLDTLLTERGAHFSLMRHTIGSSDLSSSAYTYDDNDGEPDEDLSAFSLGAHGTAMAKLLAHMREINPQLQIVGSSWSAPGWMKLNHKLSGQSTHNYLNDGWFTSGGVGSRGYSDSFAQYFVKYLQAYESLGAKVNAFSIQNEPLNTKAGYPTMYIHANESARLIGDHVGPAVRSAGLDTAIWALDDNTDNVYYPEAVLDYAEDFVQAVAWHCYASPADWTVLTEFHKQHPNTEQYMTECWTSDSLNWTHAARFTMGPLQNWANGVTAWTLGANENSGPHLRTGGCHSCDGLVTLNRASSNYTFSIDYYMMAQFSKFIPPGARILQGNGSHTATNGNGIQSVASVNPDGTRTVVVENTFGYDVFVTADFLSGDTWSGNVPATSVTTWVLPGQGLFPHSVEQS